MSPRLLVMSSSRELHLLVAKHVEIEEEGIIDGEYLEVGEEPKELPAHEEE